MNSPADMDAASWRDLLSQNNRFVTLQTALPDALLVERMQGVEGLNQDFEFTLDCVSTSAYLNIASLVDRAVNLQMVMANGRLRSWQGLVVEAEQQASDGGLARYRLTVASWLSLLKQRRNTLIFREKDALGIAAQVFADYPQANWLHDVSQPLASRSICTQYRETDFEFVTRVLSEDGLSFRFEQADEPSQDPDGLPNGSARLIIFDRYSAWPEGDSVPFSRIDATEKSDGISRFSEQITICSDSVTTTRWDPALMRAVSGTAYQTDGNDGPELPPRELFDVEPPLALTTSDQADLFASLQLDAARMQAKRYAGEGALRQLQAGRCYTLTGHSGHHEQAFICLRVTHSAVNNLGVLASQILREPGLEAGSYRNSFTAIPAGVRVVPARLPRPVASGTQSAIVVGSASQVITSNRDHQVRVQFSWQRGTRPLHGGLHDTQSLGTPDGHAPGDESSGNWVRVAEDAAGNNFGQHFTPRIGAEVLIGFTNGDIDQPSIIGQLYGGRDFPPFSAGVDAPANHPGTLSGLKTRNLDGTPASQWVLDDASGQLRHELRNATGDSHLALGYLIAQQGAERGAYRGEGFVDSTDAWGHVRAGQGLLFSASRRSGAVSTQMDISEAHAQLKGAVATASRLDQATRLADAGALLANVSQRTLVDSLDPTLGAHHPAQVNGQDATQPNGQQRNGGAPVPRFNAPHIVLETPSHLNMTTPNSSVAFAGESLHITAQQDGHFSAGHSIAGVSGDSIQWFTTEGGAKVVAHNGSVSVQAHSDALEILADQSLTVTATDECVELITKEKIVLQSGTSSITLQGMDITFACDGTFNVKGAEHPILGGAKASIDAEKFKLPTGVTPGAMATPWALKKVHTPLGNSLVEVPEEAEEEEEEVELEQLITLRIGVFFDGTGNNRDNSEKVKGCFARDVNLAEAAPDIAQFCKQHGFDGNGGAPDNSYGNDSSNVAKLYELYRDDSNLQVPADVAEASFPVYVEGIGTSSTQSDSRYSQATGLGAQGVRARVEESPALLLKTLRTFEQNNPEKRIKRIEFDIFGFSRGAAAARDFANEILKGTNSILAKAVPAGTVGLVDSFAWQRQKDFCINFIGIFDTVAAVADWMHGDFTGNNAINPGINIRLSPGTAKKIVHLVASDERRFNFSLNNAGDADIRMPGVHSDLGGGYLPKAIERVMLSKPSHSEVDWFATTVSSSSYKQAQADLMKLQAQYAKYDLPLEITTWQEEIDQRAKGDRRRAKRIHAAVSSKREVRSGLALVYMRIMRKLAAESGVPFREILESNKGLALPDELLPIAEKLTAYASGQTNTHGLNATEESLLYRRYVHLSSHWNPATNMNASSDVVFINRPTENNLRREHPND
jgi:type VI secretion system secreted protein VgrG